MNLTSMRSVQFEAGLPKLSAVRVEEFLRHVDGWQATNDRLVKTFKFEDFVKAMQFLNRVAELAEREQHHPDFCVHYNRVDFTLWTHTVGGLSENDFILAAKIDALVKRPDHA
jgi:4a-hydroxytetrahydrobiopterin dehydratase